MCGYEDKVCDQLLWYFQLHKLIRINVGRIKSCHGTGRDAKICDF
jgi:hypothetical protein